MSLLTTVVDVLTIVPTLLPDPDPEAPPGAAGPVALIFGWLKWVALIAAVAGIIVIAVKIVFNVRRGEAAGELGQLGYVMIGIVLVSSAVSIVGFVSGA